MKEKIKELDYFEQLEVLQYMIFMKIKHRLNVSEKGKITITLNF